jgi:hypothetical protein
MAEIIASLILVSDFSSSFRDGPPLFYPGIDFFKKEEKGENPSSGNKGGSNRRAL